MSNTIVPKMNANRFMEQSNKKTNCLLGLKALESYVDPETFVYILRSIYRIVFTARDFKENKAQLRRRILEFETQSNLPGFMSALPVEELLAELEDAQFLYPISRKEVTLPTFR